MRFLLAQHAHRRWPAAIRKFRFAGKLAHEQLEHGGVGHAAREGLLEHGEPIQVGGQGAGDGAQGRSPLKRDFVAARRTRCAYPSLSCNIHAALALRTYGT